MKPGDLPNVSFYSISREFISPKASDEERSKMDPEQTSELMYAAFNGTPYPQRLMYTMIRRIKTDSGMSLQRTLIRTGMVKACIARNQRLRNQKEEITMAWDETNQKIQRDSAKGVSLNKTIKDSYFSSACSCPMAIMPRLEKLSSNHMKKFKEGQKIYYQNLINSLMDSLSGKFPATMTLEEQGTFIIGYHQMNNWLYTKKEAGESDTNIEEE